MNICIYFAMSFTKNGFVIKYYDFQSMFFSCFFLLIYDNIFWQNYFIKYCVYIYKINMRLWTCIFLLKSLLILLAVPAWLWHIPAHKVSVISVFAASVKQMQNYYMCINFVPQINVFNIIFPTASFCLPSADVLFMHV